MTPEEKIEAIRWWNEESGMHPLTCGNDSTHGALTGKAVANPEDNGVIAVCGVCCWWQSGCDVPACVFEAWLEHRLAKAEERIADLEAIVKPPEIVPGYCFLCCAGIVDVKRATKDENVLGWYVRCRSCTTCGPVCDTRGKAIEAWNERLKEKAEECTGVRRLPPQVSEIMPLPANPDAVIRNFEINCEPPCSRCGGWSEHAPWCDRQEEVRRDG